jgi:hypothetical protein
LLWASPLPPRLWRAIVYSREPTLTLDELMLLSTFIDSMDLSPGKLIDVNESLVVQPWRIGKALTA